MNLLEPDRSLVLLKATGQVPHEEGPAVRPGIPGVPCHPRLDRGGRATRPGPRPGGSGSGLRSRGSIVRARAVVARFADGTEADVTPFCELRARDTDGADVSTSGAVRGVGSGDTAVVAAFSGLVAAARVFIPTGRPVVVPEVPAADFVDREVYAKLRALGVEPSGPAPDSEFLRGVTLDAIGTLPAAGEVLAFLADGLADTRSETIDRLLAHPMHAGPWATRYRDITGGDVAAMEGPDELRPVGAGSGTTGSGRGSPRTPPDDQIANGVRCATSRDGEDAPGWARREVGRARALRDGDETGYAAKPGLDLFWSRLVNGE